MTPLTRLPSALLTAALLLSTMGCDSSSAVPSASIPYLVDPVYRRASLEASLVEPSNDYSRLRLSHYATGGAVDWDHLPEWNPIAEPLSVSDLGRGDVGSVSPRAAPLALPGDIESEDDARLLELGRQAFSRYPSQLAPELEVALRSRDEAARFGLWLDDARGVAGLARARMADGSTALALTCATCHSSVRDSVVVDGLPNASLDLGAAIVATAGNPINGAALSSWGGGRVDVTTSAGTEPARIPDLRAVRYLTHLHQDATVRQVDLTSLAIRIETLVITAHGQTIRPPRIVALALAVYVSGLARSLPPPSVAEAASPRGAALFVDGCASCHSPPAMTGAPVTLSLIGTDDTLGRSADRGTGAYRVPSLRGVGTRGPLLHDGTVPSLHALLDPTRTSPDYAHRLHGKGAVMGHAYGLDLSEDERAALVDYLSAL